MLPISGSRRPLPSTMSSTPYTAGGRVSPRLRGLAKSTLILTTLCSRVFASSPSTLPYIPTTILIPYSPSPDEGSIPAQPINSNKAYIFSPNPDGSGAVDLLALDLSQSISASSQPVPVPLGSGSSDDIPPFLTSSDSNGGGSFPVFAPSILPNGTLVILSGGADSCSSSENTATLYTYSSTVSSSASSPRVTTGVWTSQEITPSTKNSWDPSESLNPYFLSSAIQFISQLAPTSSEPVFYLYGGMCPFPNASSSSWQSSATYSNKMLRISPAGPPSDLKPRDEKDGGNGNGISAKGGYALSLASSSGGPPVAEAGFSFTPLTPPSIANRSGGIVTQQMSYVMLGGHTQSAFVNMSTAAVWSLPEETWTFVAIKDSEPETTKVDLAVKDVTITVPVTRKVDSRSGHSAVLSEDGSRLVIFGGWVGDVGQAAEPQLVVVEIGPGLGDWSFRIPSSHAGIDNEKGIYGHGAVLLPGNVMMVYGGYEISPSPSKRQVSGSGATFFNISSMEWQDAYVHPSASSSSPGSPGGGGGSSSGNPKNSDADSEKSTTPASSPKTLGLGIGLGLGIPFLLGLIIAAGCLYRRRQRRRAERDEALRGLAQGIPPGSSRHARAGSYDIDEMMERNDPNSGIGFFPWDADRAQEWYSGGLDPYSPTDTFSAASGSGKRRRSLGYETLRGGNRNGKTYNLPPLPPAPLMTSNLFGMGGSGSSSSSGRPRGSVARGLYQPTTGQSSDFGGTLLRSPRSNRIHPIYEDDEDDDLEDGDLGNGKHPLSPDDERDDPFLTPTRESPSPTRIGGGGGFGGAGLFPPPRSSGSTSTSTNSRGTPSPEMVQVGDSTSGGPSSSGLKTTGGGSQQDAEVQGWVSDVDAADAVLTARISRHGSTTTMPPALKLAGPSSGNTGGGNTGGPKTPTRLGPPQPPHPTRGGSSRSATAAAAAAAAALEQDDTGRTGSNLSDASAFSFVPGAERAHLRASAFGTNPSSAGGNTGGINRSESSSGSSAKTYSTAKSNFASLQAEGPGLLLGSKAQNRHSYPQGPGNHHPSPLEQEYHAYYYEEDPHPAPGQEEEDEYGMPPGSPSKSKPRRSWFGSLRRVFSGGTPSPSASSRGDSPTLPDSGNADSSSRLLVGMGPNGQLLTKRKQGREAWEAHLLGIEPPPAGGSADGNGGEEGEWDVEKAVEQRLVQVMFTVPKERLRVVNAEIEPSLRDEEGVNAVEKINMEGHVAVVVDPERESYRSGSSADSASRSAAASLESRDDEEREDAKGKDQGKGKEKEKVPSPVPAPVPLPVPISGTATGTISVSTYPGQQNQAGHEQRNLKQQPLENKAETTTDTQPHHLDRHTTAGGGTGVGDVFSVHAHDDSQQQKRESLSVGDVSPSPSMRGLGRTASNATATSTILLHTAEMVRLERPRTRVLEMVETIESKSREGSPSPVRG